MQRMLKLVFLLCLFPVFMTSSVGAHEITPSIMDMDISKDKDISIYWEVNLEAMLADIGPEHDQTSESPNASIYDFYRGLSPEKLNEIYQKQKQQIEDSVEIFSGDEPIKIMIERVDIPLIGDIELARQTKLLLKGSAPLAEQLFVQIAPKYGDVVLRISGAESQSVENEPSFQQSIEAYYLKAGQKSAPIVILDDERGAKIEKRSTFEVIFEYIKIGYVHIIPKGLDHILFVLGLFFLSTRLKPLLWQVTSFTIAHSITIALSLLGVVSLPPEIVEPLIALSIVYVAVENIITKELHIWRPIIVFCFGLLHGLGFAGILQEIGFSDGQFLTSLISFNVGIELGQLTVILIALLLLWKVRNKLYYRKYFAIPASLIIAVIGAYWTVERVFL